MRTTVALPSVREPSRGRAACTARAIVQRALLLPLIRWLARPLRVEGRGDLRGDGPFVFVANHQSHADTAALLAALPPRIRRRTAPAAAADYFFSSRVRGFFVTLVTGAFPFPRHGHAGVHRADRLLAAGWSIVLFPEGTRSCDGAVHDFKAGVSSLAAAGWTIVPVGLAGTGAVLPKGARLPRRTPVAVAIGEPVTFASGVDPACMLHQRVRALVEVASRRVAPPRARLYERAGAFARSRRALALCLAWGIAEALWFPVVPDFAVMPLALAAPGRALALVSFAAAGSVLGGAGAFVLGSHGDAVVSSLPLVTERMGSFARGALSAGAEGLFRQPLSGVPYKAFAYQAAGSGIGLGSFVWFSLLARGGRLVVVGGFSAALGAAGRRLWPHVYGAFVALFTLCFSIGLARVVAGWS